MKKWVDLNYNNVPPKSKVDAAYNYFRSEYIYLIGYLQDGRLEVDNGFAERAIRQFGIGPIIGGKTSSWIDGGIWGFLSLS